MSIAMPAMRAPRAHDAFARDFAGRVIRAALALLGVLIVIAGVLIAPLPGPGGLPVVVVGLMIVLRNSFKARRQFVRFHHAHPRLIYPIRRLLRRNPRVVALAWHNVLRIERLVVPRKLRFAVRTRRRFHTNK